MANIVMMLRNFNALAIIIVITIMICQTTAQSTPSPLPIPSQTTNRPPPPTMPSQWKTQWIGNFTYTGCVFSGYMYYNNDLKQLRTDELFAWNSSAQCSFFLHGFLFEQDFNVFDDGVIYNYYLPVGEGALNCTLIDLPNWWAPNYLQNSTYVGTKEVMGIDCYEYQNENLFIAGPVITYVSMAKNEIIGMRVEQPPVYFEDYTVIFQSGLRQEPVGAAAFSRPSTECIKQSEDEKEKRKFSHLFPFRL